MKRRIYEIDLKINNIPIKRVIIDPHYEIRHSESINDELIIDLAKTLNGKMFEAETIKEPFSYFVIDQILHRGKFYKLIWLLEEEQQYIGIINAYRR